MISNLLSFEALGDFLVEDSPKDLKHGDLVGYPKPNNHYFVGRVHGPSIDHEVWVACVNCGLAHVKKYPISSLVQLVKVGVDQPGLNEGEWSGEEIDYEIKNN